MTPEYRKKVIDRLVNKSEWNEQTGCRDWTGYIGPDGYGQTSFNGRATIRTHQVAYILAYDPIPEGLVVRHMCHNPKCINPQHLKSGTQADNMRDRDEAGRNGDTKGIKNANAKLTNELAISIIEGVYLHKKSRKDVANQYGVGVTAADKIVNGTNWKHISTPFFIKHNIKPTKERPKVGRPSKEVIAQEVAASSKVAVAAKYGVSEAAVRKWLKS